MAIPTLLLKPEGSRDRNGVVAPTISGGVLTVPGKDGNAWQVAEATTNLVTNPSFETNISGWGPASAATTLTRRTDDSVVGSSCLDVTVSSASTGGAIHAATMPFNTTTPISIRFAVKGSGVVIRSRLSVRNSAGTPIFNNDEVITTTGEWTEYTFAYTTANGLAVSAEWNFSTNTPGPAWFRLDKLQAESKAYVTPYCDGSLGAGHTWAGVAHASASSRSVGSVAVAKPITTLRGSMVARIYRASSSQGYAFSLDSYRVAGMDWVALGWLASGKALMRMVTGTVTEKSLTAATATVPIREWCVLYAEWDGVNVAVSVNNSPLERGTRDAPTGIGQGGVRVGYVNSSEIANGRIEQEVFFDRPLTTAERSKLVNAAQSWAWTVLAPEVGGILRLGGAEPLGILRVGGSDL